MIEKKTVWYSVKEDGLPKESGRYLVQFENGMDVIPFSAHYGCFGCYSDAGLSEEELTRKREIYSGVTYWAKPVPIKVMEDVLVPVSALKQFIEDIKSNTEADELINTIVDYAEGKDIYPSESIVPVMSKIIAENIKE
jgi:hypothetical protein